MTASSSACTPLFLNEAPQSTGTIVPAMVAFRIAPLDLVERQLLAAEVLLHQLVVVLDRGLDHLVARLLDPLAGTRRAPASR